MSFCANASSVKQDAMKLTLQAALQAALSGSFGTVRAECLCGLGVCCGKGFQCQADRMNVLGWTAAD
jgi:hypothetical protein